MVDIEENRAQRKKIQDTPEPVLTKMKDHVEEDLTEEGAEEEGGVEVEDAADPTTTTDTVMMSIQDTTTIGENHMEEKEEITKGIEAIGETLTGVIQIMKGIDTTTEIEAGIVSELKREITETTEKDLTTETLDIGITSIRKEPTIDSLVTERSLVTKCPVASTELKKKSTVTTEEMTTARNLTMIGETTAKRIITDLTEAIEGAVAQAMDVEVATEAPEAIEGDNAILRII